MAPQTINVLLTTFPGLGLPRTLNLQVPSTSTVGDVERAITARLPQDITNLNLTTTSNKILSSRRSQPVTSLLDSDDDSFLPLRLSAGLCGGKGGFGSQLRAAGGRMKKRKGDRDADHSSRVLGGPRVHVKREVQALAEYLAIKPEMDKREKEERRQRLQAIIDSTEAKKASILKPKTRIDGEWLEAKEEAAEKTRQDVLAALKAGEIKDVYGEWEDEDSADCSQDEGSDSEEAPSEPAKREKSSKQAAPMKLFGWDEDEISDSDEDEEIENEKPGEVIMEEKPATSKGKKKI